jgi:hypothetical protein
MLFGAFDKLCSIVKRATIISTQKIMKIKQVQMREVPFEHDGLLTHGAI